jgi:hypothetical protein
LWILARFYNDLTLIFKFAELGVWLYAVPLKDIEPMDDHLRTKALVIDEFLDRAGFA